MRHLKPFDKISNLALADRPDNKGNVKPSAMADTVPRLTFYEFFAGVGMAKAGLAEGWTCVFANDFDKTKARVYRENWGDELRCCDVATLSAAELPGVADLAWASFPCQDLSLAGDYRGLGECDQNERTRSGAFWPFWALIKRLANEGRAPKAIMLENVCGAITARGGKDFAAIATAVIEAGYRFGALVVDAVWFVPQSRPRLFIFAIKRDAHIPPGLIDATPTDRWHPPSLLAARATLPAAVRQNWIWWRLPLPRKRKEVFSDVIEDDPTGVEWDSPTETIRLLAMMSDLNKQKVRAAKVSGRRIIGGVYKRTRMKDGVKVQRAEVRFDNVSGCLRTPRGGSSRQRILVIEGNNIRSRLLSPREAARLMGLPDSFKLPANYNEAYHAAGDGVVVGVVRHLARNLIEPALGVGEEPPQAAE